MEAPKKANQVWSMDFMSDRLENGQAIRTLNIIDDFNREVVHIDVGLSIPGERVVRVFEDLIDYRGKPKAVRVDNGPEFRGNAFQKYCEQKQIEIKYIQPGKPTQNAYIERFNRAYREDVLDSWLFYDLDQVRQLTMEWVEDYNANHPHGALGGLSPQGFAERRAVNSG